MTAGVRRPPQLLDVLVIGAGQAGLAAGYWLGRSRLSFQIVERASRVGDSWRRRWESLTLFTPVAHSSLPGLAMPGEPDAYPTRDEVADYLDSYARHFRLPIRFSDGVRRLTSDGSGFSAILASGSLLRARAVIVATGAFQVPRVLPAARDLPSTVTQLSPTTYRNPAATPNGRVLVVGDGATGRQIALELATAGRLVSLATGRPRRVTAERVGGRSVFWWLSRAGALAAHRDSLVGRYLRRTDPFPGRHLSLRALAARGVKIRGPLSGFSDAVPRFADGAAESVSVVVWATGYTDETGWLAIAGATDAQGRIIETDGFAPVSGLHFAGRSWQRSRGSALLSGVGADARHVVDHITDSLDVSSSRVAAHHHRHHHDAPASQRPGCRLSAIRL
ncbi:MAG TPA: NAD(P)/FAD-dependent oxidoreductase [Candidatus Limnocylindria bacterium]